MTPTLNLLPDSTPLANQVAGHQNVLSDASGSLVIKPALPREIAFYQLVNSSPHSSLIARLKPFLAQFYGTLRLEGRLNPGGILDRDVIQEMDVPESVVLENLAHAYTRPSILDVKLGTVTYAPDASAEKRAKMEAKIREGTSLETGMRLTGCQTWHAPTQSYILTPKSFGKSLVPPQLPIGIIRFFPLPNDAIPSLALPLTPPASTTAISPNFTPAPTHLPLPPSFSSLPDPVTPCHSNTYTGHAIPAHSVLKVLGILEEQIDRLVSVVENLEMRFIGASVLIVYEGDEKRLASALERYDAHAQVASLNNHTTTLHKALAAYDSDDEEDEEDGMYSGESSTSSDDDEDDGTRVDARRARRCPPVSLRLIDFAHTRLAEGEGPDEGVLLGLKSLVDLVNRRKEEVVTYIAFEGKEQERPGRGATLPDGEKHG